MLQNSTMTAIRGRLTAWPQRDEESCQRQVAGVPTNAQRMGRCVQAADAEQHCLNQHVKFT